LVWLSTFWQIHSLTSASLGALKWTFEGKKNISFFLLKFCQNKMMQESEGHWETLREHEDYEIWTDFPYQIRKKKNGKIIMENLNKTTGYLRVKLNEKYIDKHRLIAIQFIPNPDFLPQVDHVNHDRTDYHLSNLRWISVSNNNRNKSIHAGVVYTFVDEISPEAIHVTEYSGNEFTDLYYHENTFFYWNGIQYRKLNITELKNGAFVVNIRSINHHNVAIYYSKFKREYDLI
jgi:hypothetical protein